MALRDSYTTDFDEDVPTEPTTQCPECGGWVTTNVVVTSCEDCGLVIDDQRPVQGAEFA